MRNRFGQRAGVPIYFAVVLLLTAFLLYRCSYGFADIDEAGTYLTIPYRACLGDTLVFKEWHVSQLSAFLTMPLMKIFLLFSHNTDGIVIFFRRVFVFVWALSALFVFFRFKRFTFPGAAFFSVMFLLFSPFGISNFSYHSMGVLFLVLIGTILSTMTEHKRFQYAVTGFLFAGAVLCCPYLLLFYPVVSIILLISWLLRGRKSNPDHPWIFFTMGAFLLAFVFFIYILSSGQISKLGITLKNILNDPEHPQTDFLAHLGDYFTVFWNYGRNSIVLCIIPILLLVALLIRRPWVRSCCLILNILLVMGGIFYSRRYINYDMAPMTLLGPMCFILGFRDKLIQRCFLYFWCPGVLYSFCLFFSSNQEYYAISSALSVSSMAAMIIIWLLIRQFPSEGLRPILRYAVIASVTVLSLFQIGMQAKIRYSMVFWEYDVKELVCEIDAGPQKGIYTSQEKKDDYDRYYQAIKSIESEHSIHSATAVSHKAWLYPIFNTEICCPCVWPAGLDYYNYTTERYRTYYALFPEKVPDLVYIDQEYAMYKDFFLTEYGYELSQNGLGDYILLRPNL